MIFKSLFAYTTFKGNKFEGYTILITHAILLKHSDDVEESKLEFVEPLEAFSHFLNNHQNVGCNIDESIVTLLQLAKRILAAKFSYRNYEDLKSGIEKFIEFTNK